MNAQIFREYDIRGVAERDMPDAWCRDLGRALGTFWKKHGKKRVAVGRDCRLSSPRLFAWLTDGLLQTGMELVDVGVVPSPLLYFSVHHLNLDGGVQITGSHNPPNENGFKMMTGKDSLFGEDIQTLRALMEKQDFALAPLGKIESFDPMPAYVQTMKENIKLGRKNIRFAVDAGNGAGGPLALAAMTGLGLKPEALLCEMDGRFPVHHPDPTEPKNMETLIERVKSQNLELGIAYDGDADRIGVVDEQGNILWGDKLLILFARDVLEGHPGATVLGEVKCSQTLFDDIAAHGGRALMCKTGHSLIKKRIKEDHALLAGEMSGHIFFADRYFGFDDAIYASLRLLEIVSKSSKPLSQLLADVPITFATPEIRVACPDTQKFAVVEKVAAHYRPTHEVSEIDGARIRFGEGWGLVRASNTQPVLVLRFEAASLEHLQEIQNEVQAVVRTASN